MNIELKPADTDQNYVQGIVDLLHEYDFVDQCMLGSQSVAALREAKELDPDISTLYIMTMAFGDLQACRESMDSASNIRILVTTW